MSDQSEAAKAVPLSQLPDAHGHFGPYGGMFVAETLMEPLEELRLAYEHYRNDPGFQAELDADLAHYVGRPSPLYHAVRWSRELGGAQIYLKREDLNHTGAHKINNTMGQGLLARHMGKKRIIAETGAGQHGVASATVAARLGMECVVYMGAEDIKRQAINVYRMRLLGAEVVPVTSGSRTLKDALNEAMRDWVTNVDNTFYIIGTVAGPHPYPAMVRDFQAIIGREARRRSRTRPAACPTPWWLASAAVPTPWGCSTRSWKIRTLRCTVWRQPVTACRAAIMPRRSVQVVRAFCTATAPI